MSEKMSPTTNALNWFEIPVSDAMRAKKFYETIFQIEMQTMDMMGMKMVMFPTEASHSGGALVQGPMHHPSDKGSIIYLNANPDLQLVLDRIVWAGGEVLMPKTHISDEIGAMAFFRDSEGNHVALHSKS